ncbi:MAG: hypothetical protein ACRD2T_04675, partial [Thermoanaerobaculia bacterium]
MSSSAAQVVLRTPVHPPQGDGGSLEKTPAQRVVRLAFLVGVTVGSLQILLSALGLWVALDLLQGGVLVTANSILLPLGCLAAYLLAFSSMAGLRKHQRFRSWFPALCHLAGMGVGTFMVLLHQTRHFGEGGVTGFFLQLGASAPAAKLLGLLTPVPMAALALALAGILGSLPLLSIFYLWVRSDSRRLLR